MKKIIALLLCVILLLYCASCAPQTNETASADPIKYDSLIVDLSVNNDGYYALMSKADIHYGQAGNIDYIYLKDPALLGFKVSSEMGGGVYVMKRNAGDSAISTLTEVSQELHAIGEDNLANRIEAVISIIGTPYTESST